MLRKSRVYVADGLLPQAINYLGGRSEDAVGAIPGILLPVTSLNFPLVSALLVKNVTTFSAGDW